MNMTLKMLMILILAYWAS